MKIDLSIEQQGNNININLGGNFLKSRGVKSEINSAKGSVAQIIEFGTFQNLIECKDQLQELSDQDVDQLIPIIKLKSGGHESEIGPKNTFESLKGVERGTEPMIIEMINEMISNQKELVGRQEKLFKELDKEEVYREKRDPLIEQLKNINELLFSLMEGFIEDLVYSQLPLKMREILQKVQDQGHSNNIAALFAQSFNSKKGKSTRVAGSPKQDQRKRAIALSYMATEIPLTFENHRKRVEFMYFMAGFELTQKHRDTPEYDAVKDVFKGTNNIKEKFSKQSLEAVYNVFKDLHNERLLDKIQMDLNKFE